jgi:predicted kinase
MLARALAPLLTPPPGALVFRSDVERKAFYGVTEYERLPPEAYRSEISQTVYGIVIDKAARVARAGHSAIVDAVFATAEERAALETAVAGARVEFCGLFLFTDLTTRLQRVGARTPDASDADAGVVRKQEEFTIRSNTWECVDASGSPEQTLANALAAIK